MRLRACMGGALLLCAACAQLPTVVRVEVDGTTVEIKKPARPAPAPEPSSDDRRR